MISTQLSFRKPPRPVVRCTGQRAFLAVGHFAAALLLSRAALAQPGAIQQDPQQAYAAIKEVAREFAIADSTVIIRPEFRVNRVARLLSYDLGHVPRVRLQLDPTNPLSDVLEAQLRIEVLRRGLEESEVGTAPVQRHLDSADSAVFQMVQAIVQAQRDPNAPPPALTFARSQRLINDEFRFIGQVIRTWAREQGLGVQMAARLPYNEYYQVKVRSNPSGGRIEVVPDLDYDTAMKLGRSPNSLAWRTLGANKENLIGWYYYRITWPTLPVQHGRVLVNSAHDLTLPHP